MKGFLKGGVITRIDLKRSTNREINFLNNYFDLKHYDKNNNTYFLKEKVLNDNIMSFREELLSFSNYEIDSIDNSDAYVLVSTASKLLKYKIKLLDNNTKYFYTGNKKVFETEYITKPLKNVNLDMYMFPLFWCVDKIECTDFELVTIFLNQLIREAFKNKLKKSFWITLLN